MSKPQEENKDDPRRLDYYIESVKEGLPFNLPAGKIRIGELFSLISESLSEVLSGRLEIGADLCSCDLRGPVQIGAGTKIHSNVAIEGPVWIGRECQIGHGAYLRPGTVLGDGCVIGHGTEIKNTFVYPGAKLQSLSFVGDSIIGNGTRIGSGTILANRRFDQGPIPFQTGEERRDSERAFLGALIGDFTRIGAGSVLLPGSTIGPYCWLMPGMALGGWIPRAKRVSQPISLDIEDNDEMRLDS